MFRKDALCGGFISEFQIHFTKSKQDFGSVDTTGRSLFDGLNSLLQLCKRLSCGGFISELQIHFTKSKQGFRGVINKADRGFRREVPVKTIMPEYLKECFKFCAGFFIASLLEQDVAPEIERLCLIGREYCGLVTLFSCCLGFEIEGNITFRFCQLRIAKSDTVI